MRQQWMAAIAIALGAACCAPTAWAQAVIFADGYEPGPTCAPPAGLTLLAGNFDSIFGAWPYYNGPRRLRLPDGRYYALRFTATRRTGPVGPRHFHMRWSPPTESSAAIRSRLTMRSGANTCRSSCCLPYAIGSAI